ncbi:MAG: hypothetical protein U0441_24875 [Polyangiaceae bacterium]
MLVGTWLFGCVEPPMPPEGPEIPSRQEVFESERLASPAQRASVEALMAYRDRVCATIPVDSIPKAAQALRGCMGPRPLNEIELLEGLRASSRGAPDEPLILERLVADWGEVARSALIECSRFSVPVSPTVRDVEQRLAEVRALETMIERSRNEPARLCDELTQDFPKHKRRVHCPGDPPPPAGGAGSPLDEESESPNWPLPQPGKPADATVEGI